MEFNIGNKVRRKKEFFNFGHWIEECNKVDRFVDELFIIEEIPMPKHLRLVGITDIWDDDKFEGEIWNP